MKKFLALTLALCLIALSVPVFAKDVMLQAPIARTDTVIDKKGNEYVRIIVTESRTLDGIKYDAEVPVMAFGSQVQAAKALKAGDKFKGICATRGVGDRQSYTVLKIVTP